MGEKRTCLGCQHLKKVEENKSSFFACCHENFKTEGSLKLEDGKVEFISNNDPYKPFWCPKDEKKPS